MTRSSQAILGLSLALILAACGGGDAPAVDAPVESASASSEEARPFPVAPEGAMVRIVSPADGDVVDGPTVTVVLEASALSIVPAADTTPGTGHHHLFLDEDVTEAGVVIPSITGRVVHIGTGGTEYTFEDVTPGEHRLIAVVADWAHVPLMPWVVDTIRFTVR
jgi:hypothetical protein